MRAVLSIFLVGAIARAQEVNCTDAHPWSATATYTDSEKAKVHYQHHEFQALMWNSGVAPDVRRAKGTGYPWAYLGECIAGTDGEGTYTQIDCTDLPVWSGSQTYAEEGKYTVQYKAMVYKNNYWTLGEIPENSAAWSLLGQCEKGTDSDSNHHGTGIPEEFERMMCNCCVSCASLTANGPVCLDNHVAGDCFFTDCSKYNSYNPEQCKANKAKGAYSYFYSEIEAPQAPWPTPVYAPYLDGGLYPFPKLSDIATQTGVKYFVLAFLTAAQNKPLTDYGCHGYYASVIPLKTGPTSWNTQAQQNDYLYAEVNKLRKMGGDIAVSFGGYNGIEIADSDLCVSADPPQTIAKAYAEVVDYLKLNRIDFDIEGGAYSSIKRSTGWKYRFEAVKILREQYPNLQITWTLPVLPQGLTSDGVLFITDMLAADAPWTAFNLMNMDYGDSTTCPNNKMGQCGIDAIVNTAKQFYEAAKSLNLLEKYGWKSYEDVYPRLASTPMIGQNDVVTEVFTFADARQQLQDFTTKKLAWLSNWSLSRDAPCGDNRNYTDSQCSTYPEQKKELEFLNIFKAFTGAH